MTKSPCDVNISFRSVIILGTAKIIEERELKEEILHAVVAKYTPQLLHLSFPENMIKATGIIEITPVEITGKYYN